MPTSSTRRLFAAAAAALVLAAAGAGCKRNRPAPTTPARHAEIAVASGVWYRSFPPADPIARGSEVHVLDVDLRQPGVRLRVVADEPKPLGGPVFGTAHSVRDWCGRYGALGGINGGFFGETRGAQKEAIGLLVTDGVVQASGQRRLSRGGAPHRYARCVLGVASDGRPHIGWATGKRASRPVLTEYADPVDAPKGRTWPVESAVACGPRLICRGRTRVTDRDERLASPGKLYRTFVGYTVEGGQPRHLLLCVATAMEFEDAAAFIDAYCRQYHHVACYDAMCLDGGSSSQLVYRSGSGYTETFSTIVTVPTAVVVTGP